MSAEARRDVFTAIADPTRRQIIQLISRESMNLNAIAGYFEISRPAVSSHIKILTECGIVIVRQEGRERYCDANLKNLQEISDWVDQYRIFWTDRLNSLDAYLNKMQLKTKNRTKKK